MAGAALTVRLCTRPESSSQSPGALTDGDSDLAPIATSDAGPPFDGWCAFSVALGRPHHPRNLTVLEHDGQTYHLCGASASDGCDAVDMWNECGELLRADANRQWQLLAQR